MARNGGARQWFRVVDSDKGYRGPLRGSLTAAAAPARPPGEELIS
ncbi:hypothetical protein ACIRJR_19560 [Streptomyces sp. NPDC102402]